MIFTGFHPNIYKKDIATALSFLLLPWKWSQLRKGKYITEVENWLQNYFAVKYAVTFDSGRTALQKAIEAVGVTMKDEVLVQAYTCLVVSNAINWAGGKPIYVDVDENFNMDIEDLKNKITEKSKILIIQHTFGKAANLEKLIQIARENNLMIIEDCAHSLGTKYNDKLTGTFGDIGMLSFGSDKIISSSRGGALITNNEKLAEKIMLLNKKLALPTIRTTVQNLFNFPIFYIGKKMYDILLGKIFLAIAQKIGLTGKIIYKEEKACNRL
ncbi:MAG: aminotransferase class I/II-fold pyridoxal phosphate-dependent enzyme, partial [Candidatus Magasanikbacteria bacterium]